MPSCDAALRFLARHRRCGGGRAGLRWAGAPGCSTASGPWSGTPTTCASDRTAELEARRPGRRRRAAVRRARARATEHGGRRRTSARASGSPRASRRLGWSPRTKSSMVSRRPTRRSPSTGSTEISAAELRGRARERRAGGAAQRDADPAILPCASSISSPAGTSWSASRRRERRFAVLVGRAAGRLLRALLARRHRPGRAGHHPARASKPRLRARHRLAPRPAHRGRRVTS